MRTYHIYNRIVGILLLFLVISQFLVGCERRPLEERESDYADVLVELDWKQSSLKPSEATVIFYDEDGNSVRTLYMMNNREITKLPMGKYSVVAFNDKIGDFSQIAFRGVDHYKTIEIYTIELPLNSYGRSIDKMTEDTYELFASASVDIFEVTQEMLDETRSNKTLSKGASSRGQAHLVMTPIDVVALTTVTVHIENMHLIRTGSQRGTLKGFAQSVTLWNRQNSTEPMTQIIPLSYAEYYEGSKTNGFLMEHFTTFGLCTPQARNQPITFLFQAILRDKEQTKFSYQKDVTTFVDVKTELGLKIDIEIGINPGGDNPPIPIPPIIPIDDGAFQPGVGEWDEVEVIKPL